LETGPTFAHETTAMARPFQHIDVQVDGDICTVSFRDSRPDDPTVRAAAEEIESLIVDDGCRKLIFRFGPLACLYSVLIARLIKVRRSLAEKGGRLKLCEVSPQIMNVFESCQLQDYFEFCPDQAAALAALQSS
jgi:anti-sigma B factor antagonist